MIGWISMGLVWMCFSVIVYLVQLFKLTRVCMIRMFKSTYLNFFNDRELLYFAR